MTADPWDLPNPFCGCKGHHTPGGCPPGPAVITHEPLLTMEEYEAIKADICAGILETKDGDFVNPEMLPNLFSHTLDAVSELAGGTHEEHCNLEGLDPQYGCNCRVDWASSLLLTLREHAKTGTPLGEPCEPADSLDPDPRHVPRGEGR